MAVSALAISLASGCKESEPKPEKTESRADPQGRAAPERTALSDEELAERYSKWADRLDTEPAYPKSAAFALAKADLTRVTNEAKDPHLRANAALLLGALYEARGDPKLAIDHYRHATKLVDDDAGPFMALAVALAAQGEYADAVQAQKEATRLDPDNLENWLALAELFVKSGDEASAKKTYVDYEVRRKGLIDGLTLKKGDAYRVGPEERSAIAQALAAAADGGTGVALLYALKTDPHPGVRETVARVMGIQRLQMYEAPLRKHVEDEDDDDVLAAAKWALQEIARDPVEAGPVVRGPKAGDGEAPDAVKPAGGSPAPEPEPTKAEPPVQPDG